jgi:hypothetical protein
MEIDSSAAAVAAARAINSFPSVFHNFGVQRQPSRLWVWQSAFVGDTLVGRERRGC